MGRSEQRSKDGSFFVRTGVQFVHLLALAALAVVDLASKQLSIHTHTANLAPVPISVTTRRLCWNVRRSQRAVRIPSARWACGTNRLLALATIIIVNNTVLAFWVRALGRAWTSVRARFERRGDFVRQPFPAFFAQLATTQNDRHMKRREGELQQRQKLFFFAHKDPELFIRARESVRRCTNRKVCRARPTCHQARFGPPVEWCMLGWYEHRRRACRRNQDALPN